MQKYRILGKKGEGTFSEVLKCQSVENGQYYACKRMKQHFDNLDQVNNLREIQCMRRLSPHANVVDLVEVIFDKKTGTLALILELLDINLYELIKDRKTFLTELRCKEYIYQTLKALDHMHRNGIFHRDIKPENILLKNDKIKLADFGSCRSVHSKQPFTEYISTRWYRAPECLLTDGWYSYKMDLWSIGCVFAEILSLRPLFPGGNELDQINRIHKIVGTPSPDLLSKFKKSKHMDFNFPNETGRGILNILSHVPLTKDAMRIVEMLCIYDPDARPSAKQVLRHNYFKSQRDQEKRNRAGVGKLNISDLSTVSSTQSLNAKHDFKTLPKSINHNSSLIGPTLHKKTYHTNNNKANYKTMLPKIPVATFDAKPKKNVFPTAFPSIMKQEREKIKAQEDAVKRLGYAEYSLPALNRLRHGHKL